MRIHPAIKIDPASQTPIFEQIAAELERLIQAGRLESGQMLPSSRELACSLLLARGTVVRAYEVLRSKGLVRGRQGQGLIVTAAPSSVQTTKLFELSKAAVSDSIETAQANENEPSLPVEDVTKAAVPRALLPVKRWRELVLLHCRKLGQAYQMDALGPRDLREAICRFLTTTRGLVCTPEQISVYTNTDQALDTIARLLVRQHDTVVVEEPGYIGVSNIFAAAGANVIANEADDYGMVVDNLNSLRTSAKVLHTTPISQDPTGVVMSGERQTALIEWARRNDCIIVEDSWDTDFWHGRPAALCMQQKAPDQIIYLYSFWKLLFPLSTTCFLVVPSRLTPQLRRLRALINRPPIELFALTELLKTGEIDALAAKLQKSYRRRRQALIYSLSKAFGKSIRILPTCGGTHIIVRFFLKATKEHLLEMATEAGLKIISLDDYYFDGRSTDQYIIFFTNVSPTLIEEQVRAFKARSAQGH